MPEVRRSVGAAHSGRPTGGCAAQVGMEVVECPTDFVSRADGTCRLQSFPPDAGALFRATDAVHECLGMLRYRVWGRMRANGTFSES